MEIKLLNAYENLEHYLGHIDEGDAWERYMIEPFWAKLSEWAPFPVDYMKPGKIETAEEAEKQIEAFRHIDTMKLLAEFRSIAAKLPKEDDDPMTVALYPSGNTMAEGVYGTGVWGNILLNINALNDRAVSWTPFVFAHEYHHTVLGFYWYCVKGGAETKGNLLEAVINEGEADLFAQSIYPALAPSWLQGFPADREQAVWEKFKAALYQSAPVEELSPYLFGSGEQGIPEYAGYHFGSRIVKSYLGRHPGVSISQLVQVPHQELFEGSALAGQ